MSPLAGVLEQFDIILRAVKNRDMTTSIDTYCGIDFHPFNPVPSMVVIEDIAHALSNLCRFSGHCREFYCPTEDQRVLTADLKWTPAGDLTVGTELVGFDEEPHELGSCGKNRRRWRPSVVTHAQRVKRRIIRLEMSDGSITTTSAEHPWLVATKVSRNQKWLPASEIAADIANGSKRYIHKFMPTWHTLNSYEAGWLAGMYDGEGSVSFENRCGSQLSVAQKEGPILERLMNAIEYHGFDYGKRSVSLPESRVRSLQILGGWTEIARLLGSLRPTRLLSKFTEALRAGVFDKQLRCLSDPLEIVKAYDEGEQWVAGLETSTHTYLCEGYGAHNSVAQHSVLVSSILPKELKLAGLLHDGSEAYLQDICSPIKKSPQFEMYRTLEAGVEAVIAQKFGYKFPLHPSVKEADLILLATEMRDLMPYPLAKPAPPLKETIVPMSPKEAKAAFLQAYYDIRHRENEDFRG